MKQMIKLLFALIFVACDSANYKITGTIEQGQAAVDTVYLMTMEKGRPQMLAKTAVKDNSYVIDGICDTPRLCSLVTHNNGVITRDVELFLEQGDIAVSMGVKQNIVSGTMLNDRLQEFKDSTVVIAALYDEYNQKSKRPGLSDAGLREALKVMKITATVYAQYVDKFIEKNIDNPVSLYILRNNYTILNPQRGAELISLMPPAARNEEDIKSIAEYFTARASGTLNNPAVDAE